MGTVGNISPHYSQVNRAMEGLSPLLQSRDPLPARRSILKGGQRRVSCVTFGENNIIEIEKREDPIEKEGKENDEKIGQIREDRQKDDDDVPILNTRRWTDSLKIKRKKNRVKVNEDEDIEDSENKDRGVEGSEAGQEKTP